jgi:hypothetical protein
MPIRRFTSAPKFPVSFGLALAILTVCSLHSLEWNPPSAAAEPPASDVQPVSETKTVPADHPLTEALKLAKASRERLKDVKDYHCRFVKRDLVAGKVHAHSTVVKFRTKPMSVYMKFDQPKPGREVIYVEGQNGGKLLAHEPGLLGIVGTVALLPTSQRAMSESRHPITEFGLEKLVDGAIAQWENEAQFAASETKARFYPKAKLDNMECQVIETWHPVRRRQFPFYMTRLYIDNKTLFPVRLEQYGYPANAKANPPLIEEYSYYQIQTNLGYGDADFDPQNPNYGF